MMKHRFYNHQLPVLLSVFGALIALALCLKSGYAKPLEKCGFITESGKTYYYDYETHELAKGQRNLFGYWYMFDMDSGAMIKVFYHHTLETKREGKKICYYDADGKMVHGQRMIDGEWYIFSYATGEMRTGFVEIPSQNKVCYYDEDGRMLHGKQVIGGKTYYFSEETGAMLEKD